MQENDPLLNNAAGNYTYCRHVREYLMDRLAAYSKGLKELALASGYSKTEKFKVHCKEWNAFQRPIPLKYLEAIGVQMEEIEKQLEYDLRDFQAACQVPHFVSEYTVRVFCAIYKTEHFDVPVAEDEAVERVKAISEKSGFKCWFSIPELASIHVDPKEGVRKFFYKPSFRKTRNAIIFSGENRRIGKTYIKGKDASPILSLFGF